MKLFLTPSSPKKKISLNYALHHRGHYNLSFNFHLALITKQPKTLFKIAMLCHRTICIYVDAKLRNFWRQFRALNFLTLSLPMNCARPRIKPVFHLRGNGTTTRISGPAGKTRQADIIRLFIILYTHIYLEMNILKNVVPANE